MKRTWLLRMLLAPTIGLLLMPAVASEPNDDDVAAASERKFTIHGEVRARWEYVSNYNDVLDHDDDPTLDDDGNFYPYRALIGARGEFNDNIVGMVQIQNSGFFGNEPSPYRTSTDPLAQNFFNIDDSETLLYQANVTLNEIGGSHWSVRVGRQEHTLGNELQMGDADFYNGLTFDGLRGMWHGERMNLDLFHYVINELDVFPLIAELPARDEDVTFSGVTANWMFHEDQRFEPYLLFLRDGNFTAGGGEVYTLGAQYGRSIDSREQVEDSPFDWSAEVALQSGTFEPNGSDLDISAWITEGWFGYNWNHGSSARSRVHAGALIASGDDDGTDDEANGYVPLFPDEHAMNRLGDLDLFGDAFGINVVSDLTVGSTGSLSNVTDWNLGYELWANDGKHYFSASFHSLSLTDVPSGADDAIGDEIDLLYRFRYSDNVSLEGAVASLSPGDVLDAVADASDGPAPGPSADDIMRAWAQLRLRW